MGNFYEVQKKGTGYVMWTLEEWIKLTIKGLSYLMPFFVRRTSTGCIDVGIKRNKIFLTAPTALRVTHPLTSILKNCRYLFSQFSIRWRRYTKITRNLSWFLFYLVIKMGTFTSNSRFRFFWSWRYEIYEKNWI